MKVSMYTDGTLHVFFSSMGFYGPLSIYVFAILTCIVNKFIIGPVVRSVIEQEANEGEFRYS